MPHAVLDRLYSKSHYRAASCGTSGCYFISWNHKGFEKADVWRTRFVLVPGDGGPGGGHSVFPVGKLAQDKKSRVTPRV